MQFDDLENYYERMVFDAISKLSRARPELDESTLKDIACVTLNRLPAQYIRHSVDVAFYLSSAERETMDRKLEQALADATDYVTQHPRPDE